MSRRDTILTEIATCAMRFDTAGDDRWAGLNVALTVLTRHLSTEATHAEMHTALTSLDDAIGQNVHNGPVRDGLLVAHRIVLGHADNFADDVIAHA